MNHIAPAIIACLFITVLGASFAADRWHSSYARAEKARQEAVALADTRQQTIDDMTQRQSQNAALDAKYTQELADAKAESENLRADLAAGRKRLQINATCPATTGNPGATGATDAAAARLTPDAERNYQRLRTEISAITHQVEGLQQYINEQCH